ncbi:Rv2253 family sensor-like surface protein [Mycobacterium montefiorense]|uniref:Secreted protein n=1 Tax=Mycobacterium montefiorense TaxID=154654 RepID=A0AA37ULX4_9MYCO|nr:hypothetical protein [Mycobacterium montefiorense]GBG37299.1 hypothetical protein MmonteBS_16710 [Mycobacterium montefiorense]GKU35799.1 hypothetical protein NJB14191_31450 [Mycobacterium montefiorense]GKU39764.1 hypothetical protein NJB14192_17540 [Mycobacterium montefiorense]GKU47638.1 hypothetical protein NJB14194_42560 [Mycobacterium montefiorense]GKU48896.1 hypothetical protein NJB14195_01450 [Mycobacterium montefiorense]
MSGRRRTAVIALAFVSSGALSLAPAAFAADPLWNGQYILTLSANAKNGTSIAARQPEYAHRASVSITSKCTAGACTATVNDPPPPKNDSMPPTIEFTWNGSQWVREMTWQWDCLLPDGTTESDPAKSITAYTPGPNGVLTGVFHTDIKSGACQGNVDMPVSAAPANPPVV